MHSHIICIRVDAAAEGAVYEVIAGPQEQRVQVQQENCEHPAQGPAEPCRVAARRQAPVHILLF